MHQIANLSMIRKRFSSHLNTPLSANKMYMTDQAQENPLMLYLITSYSTMYDWGAAAYQLGNTSSRTITEVKQR